MTNSPASGPEQQRWKVGGLAQSGLSTRTLRYSADVARLYRISLLRRLGFQLDQIAVVLEDPQWQLGPTIVSHLALTRDGAAIAARLCTRLAAMSAALGGQRGPSPQDLF
jgi:MerR family transcriptional regulator, thiopeptide resistance regulator